MKKKNPTTLLPFGTLPFYCSGMNRKNDPRCVKVKEVSPRTACEYHTLMESKLSQCPVFEVFKKKIVTVDDVKMELPVGFLNFSLCGHGERFSTN